MSERNSISFEIDLEREGVEEQNESDYDSVSEALNKLNQEMRERRKFKRPSLNVEESW